MTQNQCLEYRSLFQAIQASRTNQAIQTSQANQANQANHQAKQVFQCLGIQGIRLEVLVYRLPSGSLGILLTMVVCRHHSNPRPYRNRLLLQRPDPLRSRYIDEL